jgi:hypothetical protein
LVTTALGNHFLELSHIHALPLSSLHSNLSYINIINIYYQQYGQFRCFGVESGPLGVVGRGLPTLRSGARLNNVFQQTGFHIQVINLIGPGDVPITSCRVRSGRKGIIIIIIQPVDKAAPLSETLFEFIHKIVEREKGRERQRKRGRRERERKREIEMKREK